MPAAEWPNARPTSGSRGHRPTISASSTTSTTPILPPADTDFAVPRGRGQRRVGTPCPPSASLFCDDSCRPARSARLEASVGKAARPSTRPVHRLPGQRLTRAAPPTRVSARPAFTRLALGVAAPKAVAEHRLQVRVPGRDWHTTTIVPERWNAALAAKNAVNELLAKGHRNVGVRIISDDADGPRPGQR